MLHTTQEQLIKFNEPVVKAHSFQGNKKSPINMVIKGLLRYGAEQSWTGYFGKPFNMTYAFSHSAQDHSLLSHYLNSIQFYLEGIEDLDDKHQAMMLTVFKRWESYANIEFIEDPMKPLLIIYQYNPVWGYGDSFNSAGITTYSNPSGGVSGIGFNRYSFMTSPVNEATLLELEAKTIKLMLHEVGHSLKLAHPFSHDYESFGVEGKEAYTSVSVMNYNIEYHQGLPVVPLTPMPYDIEAVRLLYGNNLFAGNGDTTYNLKDYLPQLKYHNETQQHSRLTYKTIISLPWDNQGIDTLSIQRMPASHLGNKINIINLLPFSRSYFETGLIAMPNIEIENVILSNEGLNGKYRIILNSLNNIVDMGDSTSSMLIVNPINTGHDTILNFNPHHHKLIIKQPLGMAKIEWNINSMGHYNITLAGYKHSYTHGTKIDFNPHNSIVLPNIHPCELGYRNVRVKQQDELDVLLNSREVDNIANNFFDAAVEFPEELAQDFQSAFARGAFLTFITQLSDEVLKKYRCSDQQIEIVHRMLQACITLYTGSMLASLAGSLAISLMRYVGASEQNALLVGMVASDAVNMASNASPLGVLKVAASSLGTYAGSYASSHFTLWCKRKLDRQCEPTVSNLHTKTSTNSQRWCN